MKSKSRQKARELLVKLQGGKCCYCECVLTPSQEPPNCLPTATTLEHLRRKADGGKDILDNLAASCYKCNYERGGVDWLTYKCYKMGEISL